MAFDGDPIGYMCDNGYNKFLESLGFGVGREPEIFQTVPLGRQGHVIGHS